MGLIGDLTRPFDGVLILSSLNEPCTAHVTRELERQGVEHLLINFEEAVLDCRWSIALGRDTRTALTSLHQGAGERAAGFSPRSVWMRRWGHPIYPAAFDETSAAFAFGEISSVVSALPEVLPGAKWVNPPAAERRASNKVFQLQLASRLGFNVPRTLVSNDADEIRRFRHEVGRAIFKPVSGFQSPLRRFNAAAQAKHGGGSVDIELGFGRHRALDLVFTQELTDERIASLDSIRWAPAIFQELIEKSADIRVTVIGDELYSCRIHSQERTDTTLDFRRMNLTVALRHELIALPASVEAKLLAFMNNTDLTFGCFDLIETPSGEFCFLEVNPAGQWLWIEQLTGAPISKALARQLMGSAD